LFHCIAEITSLQTRGNGGKQKQAGAKQCQAQEQLGLPAEAKLILEVVYTLGCAGEDL
jgi:hypothetical protein